MEHYSPAGPTHLRYQAQKTARQPVKQALFASWGAGSQNPASPDVHPPTMSSMPGNTVPAVFAIPAANRPGFTGYFIPTPPSSYRSQAWMSYAGENELPSQWADSVRPCSFPCKTSPAWNTYGRKWDERVRPKSLKPRVWPS
jgi:hypothetical protein